MFVRNPKYKNISSFSEYISAIEQEIKDEKFASALSLCNDAITFINKTSYEPRDLTAFVLAKVKIINAMVNLQDKLEAKPKATGNDAVLFKRI